MPTAGEPGADLPQEAIRASDRERDEVADALREHTAAGRLTLEEFSARLEAATRARTRGELARVLEDLPDRGDPAPAAAARVTHRGWAVAVFGDAEISGRWNPGSRTGAISIFGDAELDLRGAEVTGPTLDVDAYTVFGDVVVIVPEGAPVEVSGAGFLGDTKVEVEGPPQPGMPTIRVRAVPVLGDVRIRSTPRPPGFFARLFKGSGGSAAT